MTTISTLIAFPYEVARLPLVMIDNRLSARLSETSGTLVTLDRAIGSADKVPYTNIRPPAAKLSTTARPVAPPTASSAQGTPAA